jgi:Holliday junction resolvasome RuvABC endonuclease subunit
MSERIILGIDPGTTVMGYGLFRAKSANQSINKHSKTLFLKSKRLD